MHVAGMPWIERRPNDQTIIVVSKWREYQTRLRGELMAAEEEKRRMVQALRRPPAESYLGRLPIDVRKHVLAATVVDTLDARIEEMRQQEAAVSDLIQQRRRDILSRVDLHAGGYLEMEPEYLDACLRELALLNPTRRQ
jgi:hypothetical protein